MPDCSAAAARQTRGTTLRLEYLVRIRDQFGLVSGLTARPDAKLKEKVVIDQERLKGSSDRQTFTAVQVCAVNQNRLLVNTVSNI